MRNGRLPKKLMLERKRYHQVHRVAAVLLLLFQKSIAPARTAEKATLREDDTTGERIRCPLCKWRPAASSRWCCARSGPPENLESGCYTIWNTFETRGRCPGCGHQWRWTICLSCHGWSLHEDWYERENRER